MKAYLASGWFTPEQEKVRTKILFALTSMEIETYSPKEDGLFTPNKNPQDVFDENLRQINDADFIIASTIGKDMGTVFECGCAHMLDKPIVYVWFSDSPLNLMLSQSCARIVKSESEIFSFLIELKNKGFLALVKKQYGGQIE